MWLMIIQEASYVKCEHPVSCFSQDDTSFFFFLFFPPLQCRLSQVMQVSCASHPHPSAPLDEGGAISGHAYNLILLMPFAPKDHLVTIGWVMCYFQDTQAQFHFPCLPKEFVFILLAVYLLTSLVLSVH